MLIATTTSINSSCKHCWWRHKQYTMWW